MAFYETFNLTIDNEIVDPSSYAQGDIQTTYAGTATTITQTHTVDGYKILIEFDDDFGDNVDLYLEGSKVISSRAVIGKDHIAEAGDLSVESIVVNVGKDYEGDFKVVSYQGDTGETIGNIEALLDGNDIGYCTIAGFCNTNVGAPNYASAGIMGVGYTETTSINPAIGVRGRGVSTNTQECGGGVFDAETATGSYTYGIYSKASGGSVANYSFYGAAGFAYNLNNIITGYSTSTTTTINGATVTGQFVSRVDNGLATTAEVGLGRAENTTAARGATIYGTRSRGTLTSRTAVLADDTLLSIVAAGHDGTDLATAAQIDFQVDATPGSNDMPGRIVFSVSPDGSQTVAEAMRINNAKQAIFLAHVAATNFRLPSGGYIGYSAATTTAPTGGLRFDASNNATFTGTAQCATSITVVRNNGSAVNALYRNDGSGGITSGEVLGQFEFNGYATSTYKLGAKLDALALETFTDTQYGTRLGFYTTAQGTATGAYRAYIDSAAFYPNTTNNLDVGTTSLLFKDYYGAGNVYAATATMGTATSYTVISEEGLKYYGGATTWDDLQFPVATGKVPAANFPDYETFTTNTRAYAFEVGEYIDLQANEPSHGWKEGTTAQFHLHIATKSAIAGESAARFEIIVAHATPMGTFIETSLSANYSFSDPGAKQHFYVDIGDLDLTGYAIGTQLLCCVKRVAETTALAEYGDEIFITQVGCHLEYDSTGSRTESAK